MTRRFDPDRGHLLRAISVAVAALALTATAAHALNTRGATVRHVTIASRYVHRRERVTLVEPRGATAGRPLLVFLHGRGDNGEDANVNDAFFAALAALGDRAPAVVFPNGGNHGYWHDRRGVGWASYVLNEVIARAVAELHANAKRVAIGGISMGGFGALDIARLRPRRFCAVGAHSPALWLTAGETAPGAFDDAGDFARHDVIRAARRNPRLLGSIPVWIDAGSADPFLPGDRALDRALPSVRLHVYPGGHDGAYWRAHYGTYLRFYAAALARCRSATGQSRSVSTSIGLAKRWPWTRRQPSDRSRSRWAGVSTPSTTRSRRSERAVELASVGRLEFQ